MKFKRIAVALAVTALGATLATRWRRRPAADRSAGATSDSDLDEPPADEDVSAFIETLSRSPNAGERLAQANRTGSILRHDGAPEDLQTSNGQAGPFARSSGLSDFLRGG